MTHQLKSRDIIALGFMTFALFVGAGNIIFPPMVGLQAGEHVWTAAIGFLITAVGLPVLTVVALAKVGGGVESLSTPIGKVAGILLAVVCYLAVGPLFATPRTATVSFEVGIAPLTGDGPLPLLIYSVIYFALVILVSLYPGKLLDTVGNFLAPLKIIALIVLAVAAIIWPAGPISDALEAYRTAPFSNGFVNGYLTMDTLGAMVFGIVIVNAARSRGVSEARLLTRYTVWAGLMAGVGLTLLYLALFRLGSDSATRGPVRQRRGHSALLRAAHLRRGGQLPAGGADLHRLSGDGGGPDLRLRRVLCPVSAVLLSHAGLYPWPVLDGGLQSGPEPSDSGVNSGADRYLSAVYRTGCIKLYPQLVA